MKPKNIKLRIILILITIVIIATVITSLFFFTDIFRTKRGAFFRYLKMTEKGLNVLNISEYDEYENLMQTMPYIINGEMIVKSSSNIADSSIMDKLKLTISGKVNNEAEKANYSIKINSNNNELFNIILAKEKNNYAFNSPLISNGFIGIKNENLKEISSALVGDKYFPNELMEIKIDKLLEVSDIERKHIETYYNLLKTNSSDTSYSKGSNKLKINDEVYNTTTYTLSLQGKESADIQTSLLSKISQDSIMMDFITSKFKLLNLSEEYADINSLNLKMQDKINLLQTNYEQAENIEITVNEYRQKNLKTEIKINDDIISITHLEEGDKEIVILSFNDKAFEVGKTNEGYTFKYSYLEDDIEKSLQVTYKMEGTITNNNISNIMEITTKNGIKQVTYSYNDKIDFTNDIGAIETFDASQAAIINNYPTEQIIPFLKNLKQKINEVYISKGAQIGINLDPIFDNIE